MLLQPTRYEAPKDAEAVPPPAEGADQSVQGTIHTLGPLDIAIVYDGGQSVQCMNKYFICRISRYFASAFDGNFKEAGTRVIYLRHDFPWGVYAMLDFLKNGTYWMYPRLKEQYPHFTMLDLHVHCYILADKYDILALADYSATNYLRMAAEILSLDWSCDDPDYYDASEDVPFVEYLADDMCAAAEVSRFLNSIALLWGNTPGYDDLRTSMLQLLSACFIKLMRLKSFQYLLMFLDDFIDDMVMVLSKDDIEVTLLPIETGEGISWTFRD
ncbi:hypothetical protein BU23DRAFT_560889 [Bimuria novae-zelandiae CBS 107.79]|uniref:BTB domain-containing protein n=1 Tax=Bimuria novae-zelandiae CBS 107.79 TaxID=1447943 RepID=A0A6A5UMP3_9PLEO|nr:hypothetical protein BU23DRAFT_560889 [Bimuria novae-zelandiae CBS 107.79]